MYFIQWAVVANSFLTINIVSSVAMRARRWTRKQIQCQADRKVCSKKNALHGAEKNLEARKGEAMAEWFGVKRQWPWHPDALVYSVRGWFVVPYQLWQKEMCCWWLFRKWGQPDFREKHCLPGRHWWTSHLNFSKSCLQTFRAAPL